MDNAGRLAISHARHSSSALSNRLKQGIRSISNLVHLPDSAVELCERLRTAADQLDVSGEWPHEQMRWCAELGLFRWFIPESYGGWQWSEAQILEGYLAISQSCLTTAFVITQWHAACRRIVASENQLLKDKLLPQLANGEKFATVGISHLTTSRQHVAKPVLVAKLLADGGLLLDGYSPWVTAAPAADVIVMGATLADGRQALVALPTERSGVQAGPGQALMALTASCTDQVKLHQVPVAAEEILAGPIENVMSLNAGGGAGGLQTSTLAVGLTMAAVNFIRQQAKQRAELRPVAEKLDADTQQLRQALVDSTKAAPSITPSELRQRANSLVLRATQAGLSAAKGAGFISGHPAGRMAREAMFFLVWSCPQPVVAANLCELAQLN